MRLEDLKKRLEQLEAEADICEDEYMQDVLDQEINGLEDIIFTMEDNDISSIQSIIVSDIDWDTDGDKEIEKKLPKEVLIPITENNFNLIEDWNGDKGYAENICDFLSDNYGYCIYSFSVDIEVDELDIVKENEEENELN